MLRSRRVYTSDWVSEWVREEVWYAFKYILKAVEQSTRKFSARVSFAMWSHSNVRFVRSTTLDHHTQRHIDYTLDSISRGERRVCICLLDRFAQPCLPSAQCVSLVDTCVCVCVLVYSASLDCTKTMMITKWRWWLFTNSVDGWQLVFFFFVFVNCVQFGGCRFFCCIQLYMS